MTKTMPNFCPECEDFRRRASENPEEAQYLFGDRWLQCLEESYEVLSGCASCIIITEAIRKIATRGKTTDSRIEISSCVAIIGGFEEPTLMVFVGLDDIRSTLKMDHMQSSNLICIQIFSTSGNTTPWGPLELHNFRHVDSDPSSPACMDLAKSWFEECISSHPLCTQEGGMALPTRVIHVGSENTDPRLYVPEGLTGTWAALSHCWGKFRPLTTETHTIEDRLRGIPLHGMPKTFRDAIVLARFLGIDYLWIDSLCIIQDDKEDWERESSKMSYVYSKAVLVISAGDAEDSRKGFLAPRDDRANTSITIPYPMQESSVPGQHTIGYIQARLAPKEDQGDDIVHVKAGTAPLLESRGWVFQERFLSQRMLLYAATEMGYMCKSIGGQCECSPRRPKKRTHLGTQMFLATGDEEDAANPGPEQTPKFIRTWMKVVELYTTKDLTFENDRLPALSGVAASISKYGGGRYICGLWETSLAVQLCWYRTDKSGQELARRHDEYYVPTWSWASLISPVKFFQLDGRTKSAEILDIIVNPTTTNPYGPASGSLRLRGPMATATVETILENGRERWHLVTDDKSVYCRDLDDSLDIVGTQREVAAGEQVTLFAVNWRTGSNGETIEDSVLLLLKHTTGNKYTRIGAAESGPLRLLSVSKLKTGEVEII